MDVKQLYEIPPWEWPEEAAEVILEVLEDGQAEESDRLLAAELAGDLLVIEEKIVDALLAILYDGDESVQLRCMTGIALGPVLEHADIEAFDDPDDVPISEATFHRITQSLQELFSNVELPRRLRRRILEVAVRAPRDWQREAIREAYDGDDEDWRLTAIFCMRWVGGFEEQILEALQSDNPDIHYEAVCAAGEWQMDEAWSHVVGLVEAMDTEKPLLMAAIDAAASIRPDEAGSVLVDLTEHPDVEIAEAAQEALDTAETLSDVQDEDEDESLN